jgi:hypothetical protein
MLRAAVLLASLSVVMALPAAASDTAAARSVTIRVFVMPVTRSFKEVAPKTHGTRGEYTKGDTSSGTSILRNAVRQFDKPKGASVGTGSFAITAVSAQRVRFGAAARFPGGTVHARGLAKIEPNPKVPIVGGTGLYAGATGVATSPSTMRAG